MPKPPFTALKKEENDSESETSSSSEESEEEPVKKPPPTPKKAGEEEEDDDSDTESDSGSMTKQTAAKATTTPLKSPSSSTKRGRDAEADSDAKKVKAQENGSKASSKKPKKAGEEDEEKMKAPSEGTGAAKKEKGRKVKKDDGEKSASEAEKQQQPEEPKRKHSSGWSPKDESLLANKMLEDLKRGVDFHDKPKTDSYWTDVWESLKGRFTHDYTKDQVFEKHKRMKGKFDKLEKEKSDKEASKSARKRSNAEDALHAVFKQLWGRDEAATPTPAPAATAAGDVGEESQNDMDTSEPPVKKDEVIVPEQHRQQQLSRLTMEALSRVSMLGSDPLMGICSSLCDGIQSLVRLGIGVDSKASRDVRKRILEEQISEYSDMSRRLKLMIDYCQLEEQLLQKKLTSLESSSKH